MPNFQFNQNTRLLLEIFWASKDNFRTGACGITMEKSELVKMGLGPEHEVATAIQRLEKQGIIRVLASREKRSAEEVYLVVLPWLDSNSER